MSDHQGSGEVDRQPGSDGPTFVLPPPGHRGEEDAHGHGHDDARPRGERIPPGAAQRHANGQESERDDPCANGASGQWGVAGFAAQGGDQHHEAGHCP